MMSVKNFEAAICLESVCRCLVGCFQMGLPDKCYVSIPVV